MQNVILKDYDSSHLKIQVVKCNYQNDCKKYKEKITIYEHEQQIMLEEKKNSNEEIIKLHKLLLDKEKEIEEIHNEINKQNDKVMTVSETASSLSEKVEIINNELLEAKTQCKELNILKESNTQLKDSLAKLADDYSKNLL